MIQVPAVFTLTEYAEQVLTPALLHMFDLPDTAEGRALLDDMVEAAFDD